MKRFAVRDSLLVLFCSILLIGPLFRLKYMDNWPSIESTFIADARITAEHLPHTGWQPLWYCGTRFDYVYPPALRYGPALLAKAAHLTTARAYHLYTAILYVLGMLAVYWFVRIGTRSRSSALLSAAAAALLSPTLLLVRQLHYDSPLWVPQRLHVLTSYGEGPHMSALAILPAALAASYLALRQWRPAALALAGVLCALVVMHNFYGATALAIFFPVLVWSVWVADSGRLVWLRAAAIALLAYGLCAPWLTPSYIRITLTDMQWVSHPGNRALQLVFALILTVFCALSYRLGRGKPERFWTIYVTGLVLIIGLDVLGYYYFDARIFGEGHRLAPELDLVLILAGVEIVRRMWLVPRLRVVTAIAVAIAFVPGTIYLRNAWSPYRKLASVESGYPWKMAKWVHDNLPGQRSLPAGEVRFWFDAWADNAQMDGGSMQGMLNQIIPISTYQVMTGDKPELSVLWLQALGTDAIIVPGANSPDNYRADYKFPYKFRGAIPLLYEKMDTAVYRIPRIYPNIGRVVDRAAMASLKPINGGDDLPGLTNYVFVVENKDQPETKVTWHGFDEVNIRAKVAAGQSVLLQQTYDPAWHADENGQELEIRREPIMGFTLVDVPPGDHNITLKFETPPENLAGFGLFGLSLLAVTGLVAGRKRLLQDGPGNNRL